MHLSTIRSFHFIVLVGMLFSTVSAQVELDWYATHNGTGEQSDRFSKILLFDDLVITGGYLHNTTTSFDVIIARYYTNGELLDTLIYDYNGYYNKLSDMEIDTEGNLYLTGWVDGHNLTFLLKINLQGVILWEAYYDSTNEFNEVPNDLVLDEYGNIYLVGYIESEQNNDEDIMLLKYDNDGNLLWEQFIGEPGGFMDIGICGAIDPIGNIVIAGESSTSTSLPSITDFVVISYTSDGIQRWSVRYDSTDIYDEEPSCIAIDYQGNSIVSGYRREGGANGNFLTMKIGSMGNTLWFDEYVYNGYESHAKDMVLDDEGNIYLGGDCLHGYGIMKYDPSGNVCWFRYFDVFSDPFQPNCRSIDLDSELNVYVGGDIRNVPIYGNIITVKYDNYGNLQWVEIDDFANYEYGMDLIVGIDHNVYYCGSKQQGLPYDALIAKLVQTDDFTQIECSFSSPLDTIQISPGGGSIDYIFTIANLEAYSIDVDYWIEVSSIGGFRQLIPIDSCYQINIHPNDIFTAEGTYSVSDTIPNELYEFHLYAGEFPGYIWSWDAFFINKTDTITNVRNSTDNLQITNFNFDCTPNPFNQSTAISYQLLAFGKVNLTVYDVIGREVVKLVEGYKDAGNHEIIFDAKELVSGIYFVKLEAGGLKQTQKVILLK